MESLTTKMHAGEMFEGYCRYTIRDTGEAIIEIKLTMTASAADKCFQKKDSKSALFVVIDKSGSMSSIMPDVKS